MTSPLGPAYLPPTWRYAGDDWTGTNALTYTIYSVPPVYAADGATVATPGTPMDLTGYTVAGAVLHRPRDGVFGQRYGAQASPPLSGVTAAVLSAVSGTLALSVAKADTAALARQDVAAWYGDVAEGQAVPSGRCSLLIARPVIVDPSGAAVTVGEQPLYVF